MSAHPGTLIFEAMTLLEFKTYLKTLSHVYYASILQHVYVVGHIPILSLCFQYLTSFDDFSRCDNWV